MHGAADGAAELMIFLFWVLRKQGEGGSVEASCCMIVVNRVHESSN